MSMRYAPSVRGQHRKLLVLDIIQGNTTVAEAGRTHDLLPPKIQGRLVNAERGRKNVPLMDLLVILERYEEQLKDL